MTEGQALESAIETVKKALGERAVPSICVQLGSGLGSFVDALEESIAIPYAEIPGMPKTAVSGHAGRLVFGKLEGRDLAVLQGRFHVYEGHDPRDVVFPLRVLASAGVKTFVITNAAGGVDPDYQPGDLMLISDHLNFSGRNPLHGPHDERFGARFPDMSEAYPARLRALAKEVAGEIGQSLREGVYVVLGGPSYETPAEVRAIALLGGHAVGMSTVFEVIACNQLGAEVLGISLISNCAAGISGDPLNHSEVIEVGRQAAGRLVELLRGVIGRLAS